MTLPTARATGAAEDRGPALFAQHRGRYGSPRITADLRDEGWRVSENTVAQLMGELGLVARRKRRCKQTTRQGRGKWRAPDLIGRNFGTDRLNRKWYGDGTEIGTDEGKLYLDSVLDMGSRRIVGFGIGEHHDADLATSALRMAVAVRGGREAITEVIMHPDQGSTPRGTSRPPVAGSESPNRWAGSALPWPTRSSRAGTPPWSSSCVGSSTSPPRPTRVGGVAAWIEEYNHDRRHSSLAMRSPIAYEFALQVGTCERVQEDVA